MIPSLFETLVSSQHMAKKINFHLCNQTVEFLVFDACIFLFGGGGGGGATKCLTILKTE